MGEIGEHYRDVRKHRKRQNQRRQPNQEQQVSNQQQLNNQESRGQRQQIPRNQGQQGSNQQQPYNQENRGQPQQQPQNQERQGKRQQQPRNQEKQGQNQQNQQQLQLRNQKNPTPKQQNSPPRRCYDWVFVCGSCSYAKNRSSFKTYRKVHGTAGGIRIYGIGTVELMVPRTPNPRSGLTRLRIHNVLHIPSALANGLLIYLLPGGLRLGSDIVQVRNEDSTPLLYGTHVDNRIQLTIAGNPKGDSPLSRKGPNDLVMTSIYMSNAEMQAYESWKQYESGSGIQQPSDSEPHQSLDLGMEPSDSSDVEPDFEHDKLSPYDDPEILLISALGLAMMEDEM